MVGDSRETWEERIQRLGTRRAAAGDRGDLPCLRRISFACRSQVRSFKRVLWETPLPQNYPQESFGKANPYSRLTAVKTTLPWRAGAYRFRAGRRGRENEWVRVSTIVRQHPLRRPRGAAEGVLVAQDYNCSNPKKTEKPFASRRKSPFRSSVRTWN